jgi:hypothetical protein
MRCGRTEGRLRWGLLYVIVMLVLVAVGLVDLSVESGLLRTTLEAAATLAGLGAGPDLAP